MIKRVPEPQVIEQADTAADARRFFVLFLIIAQVAMSNVKYYTKGSSLGMKAKVIYRSTSMYYNYTDVKPR